MQRIVLWSLSGLVSALLLVNLFLGLSTRGAISRIQAVQSQVANGPQMETVLRNLSIRIAMAGEKEPAFRQIKEVFRPAKQGLGLVLESTLHKNYRHSRFSWVILIHQ